MRAFLFPSCPSERTIRQPTPLRFQKYYLVLCELHFKITVVLCTTKILRCENCCAALLLADFCCAAFRRTKRESSRSYFSSSFLFSCVFAHSSASGGAGFLSMIGFQIFARSALSAVNSFCASGTSSSA